MTSIRHLLAWLAALLVAGCDVGELPERCPRSRDDRACVRFPRAEVQHHASPADGGTVPTSRDSGLANPNAILVGEVVNARDLGGTPLRSGDAVAHGVLFRGPPLANLTDAGCDELARLGIRTVIDLRIESERASTSESPCVLDQADVVLAPLPVPYDVSPADYIADLYTTESMAAVFRVLGDDSAYPVYFHCTWGRDRTGVTAAVILSALGAERDAIMREYLLSRATVGATPASLEAVLDEIERTGGIEAYMAAAGIPDAWVATLRSVAVDPAR